MLDITALSAAAELMVTLSKLDMFEKNKMLSWLSPLIEASWPMGLDWSAFCFT